MVFDTGIDESHPSFSLKSLLLPQVKDKDIVVTKMENIDDIDKNGHGTLCAGIACGAELVKATLKHGGKSIKVCGVAPNAKLGIWKARNTEPKDQKTEFKNELKALTDYVHKFAKPPIDVLVIPSGMPDDDLGMKECIETLDGKGIIIVCSGSNSGAVSESIEYPALYPETICIGSNTVYYKPSGFSPEGEGLHFLAIGENIIGPKSKRYDPKSKKCVKCERKSVCLEEKSSELFLICDGTSFSAPAVGGLICLILQTLKSNQELPRFKLNRKFIVELLKRLTNKEGGEPWNKESGHGAIDCNKLKKFFQNPMGIIKDIKNYSDFIVWLDNEKSIQVAEVSVSAKCSPDCEECVFRVSLNCKMFKIFWLPFLDVVKFALKP